MESENTKFDIDLYKRNKMNNCQKKIPYYCRGFDALWVNLLSCYPLEFASFPSIYQVAF